MKKYFGNNEWEEFELKNGMKQGKAVYHYGEKDSEKREKEEYTYVNGLKTGASILTYTDFPWHYEEREYNNGVLDGKGIEYLRENKDSYVMKTYSDGSLNGKATYFLSVKEDVHEEFNYVDGKRSGQSITYFGGEEPSQIIAQYKNGKLNGKAIQKFGGKECEIFNYVDDVAEGNFVYFNLESETPCYEVGTYKESEKDGRGFLCTGENECDIYTYEKGQIQGEYISYLCLKQSLYFESYVAAIENAPLGTDLREENFTDLLKKDIELVEMDIKESDTYIKENYVDGEATGEIVSMIDEVLSVREVAHQINGVKQGEATEYQMSISDEVYEIFSYENGVRQGISVYFYSEENSIVEVRKYIDGEIQGEAKLYIKGKLAKVRFYENGNIVSETDVTE